MITMIEVEYKKDLRHNYMVIEENTLQKAEPYCIKVLQQQEIEGMLPVEHRCMDNKVLFYYEITSKQSMVNLLEKTNLTRDKLKSLCISILRTIERAYEYLLTEDDFILSPEYIYLDIYKNEPSLCFLPGYAKCIKDQMNRLFEYLMNKVDYNDKEAVVLVYQLYAVSKEEGYTFSHLLEVLQNSEASQQNSTLRNGMKIQSSDKLQTDCSDIKLSDGIKDVMVIPQTSFGKEIKAEAADTDFPVMMEKIEGEAEVSCYPLKSFLYAGACISAGVLIIISCFASGILFNSFGNRIDYSKLFALALIIFCGEGYLLNKLLDKKNKITKIVKTSEYIDPRQNSGPKINIPEREEICQESIGADNLLHRCNPMVKVFTEEAIKEDFEEDCNPTCLLNASSGNDGILMLKALDQANYKDIKVKEFPFFIGKLKKNVDYCLENNAVSRYHAKITKEGEIYYITDLNSTNGTFVNRELLLTYQKREIKIEDEIAFANIKYLFVKQ